MSNRPGGRRQPTRSDKTGQFKEKPQNERDLEQIIGFVNDVINSTLAMNAQLGSEMKEMGSSIIDLTDKLSASQTTTDQTKKALANVLNSPKYVKTLKKGTEDQTRQLRGLNLSFNAMNTFLSGIISGFEPIFDVIEEVGEMVGNSLRPLLSVIAEGLIPFLPVLQVALDTLSLVLTPLATAIRDLLNFLSPDELFTKGGFGDLTGAQIPGENLNIPVSVLDATGLTDDMQDLALAMRDNTELFNQILSIALQPEDVFGGHFVA